MKAKRILSIFAVLILLTTQSYAQPSDWAKEGVNKTLTYDLAPETIMSDFNKKITRGEFAHMSVKLYESITSKEAPHNYENPFSDTSDTYVLSANKLGIIKGVGGRRFAPDNPISREEISVMIYRTLKVSGIEVKEYTVSFADSNKISTWAKGAVGFMQHHNIISGVGVNLMSPKSLTTREQAMLISVRAYENFVELDSITLNNVKVSIGDSLTDVEKSLGVANRIDPSNSDYKWHVYNSDYSKFIMVGINNGIVEAIYTNSKGFKANEIYYGDLDVGKNQSVNKRVKFQFDKHDNNKVHGCLIVSRNNIKTQSFVGEFAKAQELENFDATNAFRVNNNKKPLKIDEIAVITARKHSQDMADKNYFSHTNLEGLSPGDRYKNNKGNTRGWGENIAAGNLLGIDTFDQWVNSKGHRDNMLGNHNYLGVGFAYNKSSNYIFYTTQFFSN